MTLCWLGPVGLRELGESCLALAGYAKERIDLPLAFDRPTFKEVAFRTPIPAREVVARARRARRAPRLPARPRLPGPGRRPARRAHREAHARRDRPPRGRPRGGGGLMELIFEKSRPGRRAGRVPSHDLPVPDVPDELRRRRAAAAPGGARERDRAALHRARRPKLRDRHGLLPARQLHDEAQPARQRARRGAPRLPRPPPAAGGRRGAGRAPADVGAAGDPRRGGRPACRHAPAGRRLAGRADGADADARRASPTAASPAAT